MDKHQLALRNEMALGIFERLGNRSPSEEQVKLLESFLIKFVILPNPVLNRKSHLFNR